MSLNFLNPCFDIYPYSRDDIQLRRGPIVLAKEQVNPLLEKFPSDCIPQTWRLATIGKNDLLYGARYENATWRLWAQHRANLDKIDGSWLDW